MYGFASDYHVPHHIVRPNFLNLELGADGLEVSSLRDGEKDRISLAFAMTLGAGEAVHEAFPVEGDVAVHHFRLEVDEIAVVDRLPLVCEGRRAETLLTPPHDPRLGDSRPAHRRA